ncbi:MAG: site-specific integrase [Henriciella sp.]|nr:site-specific integrase [Henriciella sp.]
MGEKKVAELAREEIVEFHLRFAKTPYQANRMLGTLSVMLSQAEIWGMRPSTMNPCLKVKRFKEKKRERYLSSEEMKRLANALDEEEKTAPVTAAAFRLLIITGCRLGEIQKLKWDWVDFEREAILLPDSKTGMKTVYLSPQGIAILRSIPRLPENPFVITGREPRSHLTDMQKPWRRIRKAAGIEDVRIHDLRHTFAATAASNGLSLPMIGKLLGHTQAQTTARYAHLAADPVRKANADVARLIAESMS